MRTVKVPPGAAPGDIMEMRRDNSNTNYSKEETATAVLVADFTKTASKYLVAVPHGPSPGDTFTIGPTLSKEEIHAFHTAAVGGRLLDTELQLCRSMVVQEVQGVFERRRTPSMLERCVRATSASACFHPCCGSCLRCAMAPPREFLVSDGDAIQHTFLFLIKEISNRSQRERCGPNHSLLLKAFPVVDERNTAGVRALRPDVSKGPVFEMERRGHWCLSCCACGAKDCHQKFVLRHSTDAHAQAASYYGQQIMGGGDARMIGSGFQTCCGGACCTPTLAVMRRDEIVTESGIGLTDKTFAFLEGPCCCTGGPVSCCKRRDKFWYISRTKGKAYDIASVSDPKKWRLPEDLDSISTGREPVLLHFRKRGGMTSAEKKLTLSTLLAREYMWMRHSSCVFCFSWHCLGGNCTV